MSQYSCSPGLVSLSTLTLLLHFRAWLQSLQPTGVPLQLPPKDEEKQFPKCAKIQIHWFSCQMLVMITYSGARLWGSSIPNSATTIIIAQINAWFSIWICQHVNSTINFIFSTIIFIIVRTFLFTSDNLVAVFALSRCTTACSPK